jgi:ectoine hydroxylase-related dioxygenase (phytanoyl-CoA dioxygenase family)
MNKHPLLPITEADALTYERDGVVCLRKVLDSDWIESILTNAKEAKLNPQKFNFLPNLTNPRYMARTMEEFREFCLNAPFAEAAGKVMRSKEIRFFFDELFSKEPGSKNSTIWHNDRPGWPIEGHMVPSIWIPLTPIKKSNCLEILAGSHRHDVLYWLFSSNAQQMIRPENRPGHPDIESLRNDPDMQFLTWDMEPGDLLIVHPWTLHYAEGNPTDDWRFAVSIRVFGDDIRWKPRPDCLNIAGISMDEMVAGEKPSGPLLPLLWSEDGARESGESYPRGFSTTWSADAYARIAAERAGGGFVAKLKEAGGPTPVPLEELRAAIKQIA